MGMYFRDIDGNESLIAGMGRSGELVPSVSYYQRGTTNVTVSQLNTAYTVTVTLSTAMPDVDYVVVVHSGAGNALARVKSQTVNSFIIEVFKIAGGTGALTCTWQAFKLMTDESRALDESQINENTTSIEALQKYRPFADSLTDCNLAIPTKEGNTVFFVMGNASNAPSTRYGTIYCWRSSTTVKQVWFSNDADEMYTRSIEVNTSTLEYTSTNYDWSSFSPAVTKGSLTLNSSASTGTITGTVTYQKSGHNISVQLNNLIIQNTGSSTATIQITTANTALFGSVTAYGFLARPAGEQSPLLVQLQNGFLRVYGVPSGGVSGWYGSVNCIV